MLQRKFLGYDSPFLPLLTEYLLANCEDLAETLIITPTSQSGRILRESLAAAANALLAPTVSTPGALLHMEDPTIAPLWLEKIAWIETLGAISSTAWEELSGLFPIPPASTEDLRDWSVSLATEITSLRATLQDHLHNLFSASKFLANTPEAERWNDLAALETKVEKLLFKWGYISRSAALRADFKLPDGYAEIILAGITEMPPCLATALEKYEGKITCLIAAPETEAPQFSDLGMPTEAWATRQFSHNAQIEIVADPAQQALAAIGAVSRIGAGSGEMAVGSADEQTGSELARQLSENGWPAFHPAAAQPLPSLVRWLVTWKDWLGNASSRNLATLLALPESAALIGGFRAQKLLNLNSLRDKHPIADPKALAEIAHSNHPELAQAISTLMLDRTKFLSKPFPEAILGHLSTLKPASETSEKLLSHIHEFLETAGSIFEKIDRSNNFWLQVLIAELPAPPPQPPADRVIDIQGWLELLYEPGAHLVICGMNETFVPAKSGGEPWLSENIRKALGLNSETDRHARDAYLLHAMLEMRAKSGSAHLICGKNGTGGETYLPSRLLLQVPRAELIPAVKNLFREIEPPESNLVWTRDFKWETHATSPRERISVTAIKDYLACPFRFYLKHVVRMNTPEPARREMNSRDFGSITHFVLECWGADLDARQLSDVEKLSKYFDAKLEEVIRTDFGNQPPLAIRIQAEAIRQRLRWFARQQAAIRADGWEITEVERKIAIESNGMVISGKIDRIDRHRKTGQLRVIDYKTGKVGDIEKEHRQKITARTVVPEHFPEDGPTFQSAIDAKGKPFDAFWKNLQLPLYALAENIGNGIPIPAYIHLGQTEDNVRLTSWDTFSEDDLESAKACADWITQNLGQNIFWPPAKKVQYDDYAILSQKQPLAEAFQSTTAE